MMEVSLEDLQQVRYSMSLPVQIVTDDDTLNCQQLLRIVPGKRLVFLGEAFNKKVIIKCFIHTGKAKKHWQREYAGAKLLTDNNILTPEIIARGCSEQGIYYLLFPYIEGQNLAQFWDNKSEQKRQKQLKQLMVLLAQHHNAGLSHQDVHYANFYLADNGSVYTLDGEEVKACGASLTIPQRLDNLALFLAQTFDLSQSVCCSLLDEYLSSTSLKLNKQDCESFWQSIKAQQQQRIKHYLKKVLRECTEVIYNRKKYSYSLCRREYYNNAIQQLLDQPERFFQDKSSQFLKQGNTCTVKSVWLDNEQLVLKRYNPKGSFYELMHKGQMSRARKSWLNAHLLRFMGLATPEPIALIEQQAALGQRCSYFICKFQPGQSSWDYFCRQSANKSIAQKLLAILQRLYDYNITHGDLKGSNILIEQDQVYLLDLDAMTQHKFHWQFNKSRQRDQQRFLKNWDKKACYKPWKSYFNSLLRE